MALSDTLERVESSQCTVGDLTRSASDEKLQFLENIWPAVTVNASITTRGSLSSKKIISR